MQFIEDLRVAYPRMPRDLLPATMREPMARTDRVVGAARLSRAAFRGAALPRPRSAIWSPTNGRDAGGRSAPRTKQELHMRKRGRGAPAFAAFRRRTGPGRLRRPPMPLTLSLNTNPLVNRRRSGRSDRDRRPGDLRLRDLQLTTNSSIRAGWPRSSAASPARWAPARGAPACASPPA